jgi:hypothetical protein
MLIVSGTVPAVMHNSYIGEGGGGALYKYWFIAEEKCRLFLNRDWSSVC